MRSEEKRMIGKIIRPTAALKVHLKTPYMIPRVWPEKKNVKPLRYL